VYAKDSSSHGVYPEFVEPMAALRVKQLPQGSEWLYEVKWDGYRVLIIKDGHSVGLISRNEKDLTKTYPSVRAAGKRLALGPPE
jgi:bifunctional non-homologous end joining protein LigD